MNEDGRTEGSPGTTHTGVVKLEEQLKPEHNGVPHTPHPLNPHNTTCMACFTSKVRSCAAMCRRARMRLDPVVVSRVMSRALSDHHAHLLFGCGAGVIFSLF